MSLAAVDERLGVDLGLVDRVATSPAAVAAAPAAPLPWGPVAAGLAGAVGLGLAAGVDPILGLLLAAALVLGIVVLRRPAVAVWVALATTAFAPQYYESLLASGSAIARAHRLAVIVALAPILLTRGLRGRTIPLPVVAYLVLLALTFTGVDRLPGLTMAKAGFAVAAFTVGWVASQVRWRRSELDTTLLVMAYLPALSVVTGAALDAAGVHPLQMAEYTGVQRLQGASIPAYFGFLCAAGAGGATALLLRPSGSARHLRPWALLALGLSIVCAGLSGTRGALIATVVVASPALVRMVRSARRRHVRLRRALLIGLLAVIGTAAVLPTLIERTKTSSTNDDLDTSGRAEAWTFYLDAMNGATLAGRGIGAGPVIGEEGFGLLRGDFRGTHNEYVRLFVESGWLGVVLVVGAVTLHLRAHLAATPAHAKAGLVALIVTFVAYSVVDNTVSTFHFFLPFGLLVGIYSSPAAVAR